MYVFLCLIEFKQTPVAWFLGGQVKKSSDTNKRICTCDIPSGESQKGMPMRNHVAGNITDGGWSFRLETWKVVGRRKEVREEVRL